MDECDRAAQSEQEYLAKIISSRRTGKGQLVINEICEDCGERIAPKRRQAAIKSGIACRLCIDCQIKFERGGHGID